VSVDRCICHDVPFRLVLDLAAEGASFEQISDQTGCGTGCGMCEPYARLAMQLGVDRLPVLSPQQCQAIRQAVAARRPLPVPVTITASPGRPMRG
jgi:bacterioferritin-associated ferredoxin